MAIGSILTISDYTWHEFKTDNNYYQLLTIGKVMVLSKSSQYKIKCTYSYSFFFYRSLIQYFKQKTVHTHLKLSTLAYMSTHKH